jgi:hypothetical protein
MQRRREAIVPSKRTLLFFGAVLLLASLPLLLQQGREAYLGSRAYERYKVEVVDGATATLNGHSVSVTNDEVVAGTRSFSRMSRSDVMLLNLFDREAHGTRVLVAERMGAVDKETWRYRIISIDDGGSVTVDEFMFGERNQRPYRVVAARFVSPEPIGFTNESLQQWPSFAYPVLYPWLTGLIGVAMMCLGIRKRPAPAST